MEDFLKSYSFVFSEENGLFVAKSKGNRIDNLYIERENFKELIKDSKLTKFLHSEEGEGFFEEREVGKTSHSSFNFADLYFVNGFSLKVCGGTEVHEYEPPVFEHGYINKDKSPNPQAYPGTIVVYATGLRSAKPNFLKFIRPENYN